MVQRNNTETESYLGSIIQWIHNSPPSKKEEHPNNDTAVNSNTANPRQQLLFTRHLKRNRHRTWRALPEFEQNEIVMTHDKLS